MDHPATAHVTSALVAAGYLVSEAVSGAAVPRPSAVRLDQDASADFPASVFLADPSTKAL
jgi:hypothetical protein